ncbi:hypothetical protein L3Q82_019525, partial [Scortum barcoo]
MDDSDQDFADLCSKLLKRVRKRPGEPSRSGRRAETCSQPGDEDKRKRRNNQRDADSRSRCVGTQPVGAEAEQAVVCGRAGLGSGDAESSAEPGPRADRALTAKDKVLQRMQQFKRASPQRMVVNKVRSQPAEHESERVPPSHPPLTQGQDIPDSFSSGLQPEPELSDEALALRLQQELDREAAGAQTVDLEDEGLFFCQICHRDLSHMTSEGRTQHLNRCLDESEESRPAPPPPPPPPGVPDCPICGKKFKSQKSRSAHLKRCSSDMGVSPAVLLQALQRQAEESQSAPTANTPAQTGGTKRKDPSKPGHQARKKPRKKAEPMDENTMVALALSSSLLKQERRQYGETESEAGAPTETTASHVATVPVLTWRPDTGKGRGKRKKGTTPRPPPLLLVQDAEAALTRLQERVSALLLRSRAPSPPTPTWCPSSLPGWSGAAPLWQKSALLDGCSTCPSDFYTPELREFITPWESTNTGGASSSPINKPESSVQPVGEGTSLSGTRASIVPSSSQTASSTPRTGQQAVQDLMDLAGDAMTFTQCGTTASGPDKDKTAAQITNLHVSGFILEESEEQADMCASGFLPERTLEPSEGPHGRARRSMDHPGADTEQGGHQRVVLSRLVSDLSSMVNNPQLSDVQLQVDSGEVYFAHSFMVYARCPLLAEMVHEGGFGVREEGMPAARRVLMSDVPGQAVFALLQYIYTASCSVPASLRPHVLELASRFDLQELQRLCDFHQEDAPTLGDDEDHANQEENVSDRTGKAITTLLNSMWTKEDGDLEGMDTDGGGGEERALGEDCRVDDLMLGDREEKVNDEELEEIYEFAATQRKRKEEAENSVEEKTTDEEENVKEESTKLSEPRRSFSVKNLQQNSQLEPDPSLERSYSRLFSDSWGVYEEGDPSPLPSTSCLAERRSPRSQQHPPPCKPSTELSGRTLLQSSVSVVEDLSLSPPPSISNLPVPGQSPGQAGESGADAVEVDTLQHKESPSLKRDSQGPRSICVPLSPDLLQEKKEPELIVLSDSSDEMEVVLNSRSPSPSPPRVVQNPQSCYTQIRPQLIMKPHEPTLVNQKSSRLEFSPDGPPAAPPQSHPEPGCDFSPADCSAEVSWLIPSTPNQSERGMATISIQTKISMCRTQLFPKADTSSPSDSVSSSPTLPFIKKTSCCSTRVSAHNGPTEGSVPRLELDQTSPSRSSFKLNLSLVKRTSCCDVSTEDREVFEVPPSQPKLTHPSSFTSSKQHTPLHIQPRPYSSTPLHTELHQPPVLPTTSPLRSNLDKQRTTCQGRAASESPAIVELESFRLSPLSDPSDLPSTFSHRLLQSSQRPSESSHQSRRSVQSSSHDNTGGELTRRGIRNEDEEREMVCENKDTEEEKSETGEAEVTESSFHQSFMDEPPIAFNDSWGFDACTDVDANPGCFSLRLEDSRASSQREGRETAMSFSPADCQPSPSSHCIQSSKSRGGERNYSASKAPLTPSPPNPTTRTTPEINSSLLDSKMWDSWGEEEEEKEALPLSQRVNPSALRKTPTLLHNKRRRTLVPITPMPHYSDMDTPELKNKLNRFGVRPLPKRQMILKLKEIHQYTHQLVSSDSEDDAPPVGRTAQVKPPPGGSVAAANGLVSAARAVNFKEPQVPVAISPVKQPREEEAELLSASQGSNTSSTAASEESERSNPELCVSSNDDSDSDGGISASQAATRLHDRLRAVRSFILSDSGLYTQILQYQPLVLSQLQQRLKEAGIRLGVAKLVDYLDSQCITFTTAKPGHSAPSRRRGKKTCKGAKAA